MQYPYWFKRASTSQKQSKTPPKNTKTPPKSQARPKKAIQKTSNQAVSTARDLLGLVQRLEELKELNLEQHGQVVKEGTVKQLQCLRHHSAVILYCPADRKLLCSVCAFSSQEHSKHHLKEARLANNQVEQYVLTCERTFKMKLQDLQEQKISWDAALDHINAIRAAALKNIQKQHDQLAAAIATQYQKSVVKIEQAFEQSKANLSFIVNSVDRLIGTLRFSHSIVAVKHLFFQEVMQKINDLSMLTPEPRLAARMAETLSLVMTGIIKGFQQSGTLIKR